LSKDVHLDNVLGTWHRNFFSVLQTAHDSRMDMELLVNRQERTVYYGDARDDQSEVLSFEEMERRAYEFSRSMQAIVVEGPSGGSTTQVSP